jgi:nucleoside-diphosphate-sugar epimerase
MSLHWASKYFGRVAIFRPHNVYGPDMGIDHVIPHSRCAWRSFCDANHAGCIAFPIEGTGRETRAFVHIDDMTEGAMCVIERAPAYERVSRRHGSGDPNRDARARSRALLRSRDRGGPRPAQAGGAPRRCPDISKLCLLGYEPRVEFEHRTSANREVVS